MEGKELREVMAPEVWGPPVLDQVSGQGATGGMGRPVTGVVPQAIWSPGFDPVFPLAGSHACPSVSPGDFVVAGNVARPGAPVSWGRPLQTLPLPGGRGCHRLMWERGVGLFLGPRWMTLSRSQNHNFQGGGSQPGSMCAPSWQLSPQGHF